MLTCLPNKCQRLLIKSLLLRISNVGGDDFIERQAMIFFFESFTMGLCPNGELATDGVLDVSDGWVKRRRGEDSHVGRRKGKGRKRAGKRVTMVVAKNSMPPLTAVIRALLCNYPRNHTCTNNIPSPSAKFSSLPRCRTAFSPPKNGSAQSLPSKNVPMA